MIEHNTPTHQLALTNVIRFGRAVGQRYCIMRRFPYSNIVATARDDAPADRDHCVRAMWIVFAFATLTKPTAGTESHHA